MEQTATTPIISVRNLSLEFATEKGIVPGLRGVGFDLHPGEKISIVGESGSGKSTTAKTLNRLLPGNATVTSGEVLFEGEDVLEMKPTRLRELRGGGIGLVPQDPMSNLNPIQTVGKQVAEALAVQGFPRAKIKPRVLELFEMVGIPDPAKRVKQYPHELSGGLRQRVLLAMGLACEPKVLIADEPTSALDVTVQRTILDKLDELIEVTGTSLILITHDLELAAERTDTVLVMRQGVLVEQGPATEILRNPQHDYTRLLVDASPTLDDEVMVTPIDRDSAQTIIEVRNLRKTYGSSKHEFTAVADSSFALMAGETVAIVGESGSGKSTTANMMLGLDAPSGGSIVVDGMDLASMRKRDLFKFRRRVQPVFQSPYGSLNPNFTIAESVAEPLVIHKIGDKAEQEQRVEDLLQQVGLSTAVANRYPRELSGGQLQRVAIARALSLSPEVLVLDEPVSALDVVVQKQILNLLVTLQQRLGLSYIFISHDLAVVRLISHYVHVMESGRIVESGSVEDVFTSPRSMYTKKLLNAIPKASF